MTVDTLASIATVAAYIFFASIICIIVYKTIRELLIPLTRHFYQMCTSAEYRAKNAALKKELASRPDEEMPFEHELNRRETLSSTDSNPWSYGSSAWHATKGTGSDCFT
jgi:hypothetical protein